MLPFRDKIPINKNVGDLTPYLAYAHNNYRLYNINYIPRYTIILLLLLLLSVDDGCRIYGDVSIKCI